MKMNNWIFHQWWGYRIEKVQSLGYKMKMETEVLLSTSIQHMLDEVSALLISFNWISRINHNYRLYFYIIWFFLVVESAIHILFAHLFVPSQNLLLHTFFAISLTISQILSIDFGLKSCYHYCEAKDKRASNELTEEQPRVYRDWRAIGIGVLCTTFVLLLSLGVARLYFVLAPDFNGLIPQKAHDIKIAKLFTSIGTLLFSFIVAWALKQKFVNVFIDVIRKFLPGIERCTGFLHLTISNT